MARTHNFAAGPAVLPVPVLEQLQPALMEFGSTGAGIMEISHRGKAFEAVIGAAEERLRRLLDIPAPYAVLFLQGGASLQFTMHALNLLRTGEAADYIVTGEWAGKALKEAKRCGDARACWDGKETGYDRVPVDGGYTVRPESVFVHYTTNNTIYGTEWHSLPECGGKHVLADMSSDICGHPVDVARHDLVYAGAQKNLGPSGVTVVILSPWALEKCPGGLSPMLDYKMQAEKKSLYNTPNTWGIFVMERVLAWIEDQGGVAGMSERNRAKAGTLYGELDRTGFWRPHARNDSRSWMNVTWRIANPELESVFLSGAEAAGLKGLKGHRSVGGIRASLYNALPPASVDALVSYMREFERTRG